MSGKAAPRPVVTIFAPLAGDAEAIADLVKEIGYESEICEDAASLFDALEAHPLCAILTEEAITDEVGKVIERHSGSAPLWSSIPLILAINRGDVLESGISRKLASTDATSKYSKLARRSAARHNGHAH